MTVLEMMDALKEMAPEGSSVVLAFRGDRLRLMVKPERGGGLTRDWNRELLEIVDCGASTPEKMILESAGAMLAMLGGKE